MLQFKFKYKKVEQKCVQIQRMLYKGNSHKNLKNVIQICTNTKINNMELKINKMAIFYAKYVPQQSIPTNNGHLDSE